MWDYIVGGLVGAALGAAATVGVQKLSRGKERTVSASKPVISREEVQSFSLGFQQLVGLLEKELDARETGVVKP